ncbi:MAG: hypothetical protein LUE93_10120 [Bacteroides sp.]|nr:hypothetical protein [Bacteroides sp.]
MRTGIFAICLCLFGFLAGSCEKLTECPELEKVAIYRILPKLDMELETDRIVNSIEELLPVLESNPGKELTILDGIDFDNFTLLLGKDYCTGTIYMESHLFMQKDDFFISIRLR